MKKTLVLIVLLLITNSFTLLAQTNQADTSASKKDAGQAPVDKKAVEKALKQANQKRQADSLANIKTLKQLAQKKQADSLATVKAAKNAAEKNKKDSLSAAKATAKNAPVVSKKDTVPVIKAAPAVSNNPKPDTVHTAKVSPPVTPEKNKVDTSSVPKKVVDTKEQKKLNPKKSTTDTLSAKSKSKEKPPKVKSAKDLKREAKKNDVSNLSEKELVKRAFQQIGSDTVIHNAATKRAEISFSNARPLELNEYAADYNIKFYHRYWRDIDLQDPKNKRFASFHADLITALLNAIKNNQIKAYNPAAISKENPTGDAFTVPIPYLELMSGLSDTSVVNILDKDGNITGTKTVPNPFTPEKISGYRIKEDVFFDKMRSKMVTRIIGLAPLVKLTLSSGEVLGIQPLCWLRFKDCRKILVTIDIDPTKKVGDSMDDLFLQRKFYGKIVQESNPEGKRIKDYKTEPADQDAEAMRIEQKVISYKKGLWNYTMLMKAPEPEPTKTKAIPKTNDKAKKEKTTVVKPQ